MTIQEARRAQGILDDEVILGTLDDKWKIIGNGVDRHAALALGMSLREAWLSNPANISFNPLRAGIMSYTTFESNNSGSMLINGLKKVAGVASRLMGGMDLAKKSEDGIQVTESVSIRKDRVFRRTQTSEETLDTLSIFSKTTARLPTNKKTKSKFHQALAPAPASITLASRQRSREKAQALNWIMPSNERKHAAPATWRVLFPLIGVKFPNG
jgi:DNA (cytosine-5)-methyltransferase 1